MSFLWTDYQAIASLLVLRITLHLNDFYLDFRVKITLTQLANHNIFKHKMNITLQLDISYSYNK